MLNPYKVSDTVEKLCIRGIKDGCVITDTHLAAVIGVSGANLFEKKEDEAVAYLRAFTNALNQLRIPVQLVTQSRPKRFDDHVAKMKAECRGNDFDIEFEKNREWFDLYYQNDLLSGKVTQDEVRRKFEAAPEKMRRSMLDSYSERVDAAVRANKIKEKNYFFVVSTLDEPSGVNEKDEQDYPRIIFENPAAFEKGKEKLQERVNKAVDLIRKSGMNAERFGDEVLENVAFDAFNFPMSAQHKIRRDLTEYGEVPPLLDGGEVSPDEIPREGVAKTVSYVESAVNAAMSAFELKYGTKETERSAKTSNPTLQLLKPYAIDDTELSHLKVNDQYLYTIHVDYFGRDYLEDLALWPILTMEYDYDLSVHLIPLNKDKMLEEFARRTDRIQRDFHEKKRKLNKHAAAVEKDKAEAAIWRIRDLEESLKATRTLVWSTSIDVTFRASSLGELEEVKESVRRKLASRQILFSEANGNHYEGFVSTCPFLVNLVSGYNRPFRRLVKMSDEISHFYPFCPMAAEDHRGIMLGIAVQGDGEDSNKSLVNFDLFDRSRVVNSNMAVVGNSGAGKTTMGQGLMKGQMLLWHRFLIIDYLGNYIRWAQDMPGAFNVIRIDQTSPDAVNPCDLYVPSNEHLEESENYRWQSDERIKEMVVNDKISELGEYFRIFLGDMYTTSNSGILESAAQRVYKRRLERVDVRKTKAVDDVFLTDIVEELLAEKDKEKRKRCQELADALSQYATGRLSGMFNKKTNVKIDGRSVLFYLRGNKSEREKEMATLQAFILIRKIAYSSHGNVMFIDELANLFRMEKKEVANFFRAQISMIRNLRGGVIGMTQLLDQVLTSEAGREFLKMSAAKLYLSGGSTGKWSISEIASFEDGLSESSKRFLLSAGRGKGILLLEGSQIQIEIQNHPDLCMFDRYEAPLDVA